MQPHVHPNIELPNGEVVKNALTILVGSTAGQGVQLCAIPPEYREDFDAEHEHQEPGAICQNLLLLICPLLRFQLRHECVVGQDGPGEEQWWISKIRETIPSPGDENCILGSLF